MTEDIAATPSVTELRRLLAAATPGPWTHGPLFWEGWSETSGERTFEVPHTYPNGATQPGVFVDPEIGRTREPDAALIVAAVNTLPALLATLDKAREDDLGAAWQAAEAALPEGGTLALASPDPHHRPERYDAEAFGPARFYRQAWGDTAILALVALTSALTSKPERSET